MARRNRFVRSAARHDMCFVKQSFARQARTWLSAGEFDRLSRERTTVMANTSTKPEDVKDKAREMGANVGQKAADVASNVSQKAQEVASNLGSTASQYAATAKEKADDAVASVGEKMTSLAGTIRESVPQEGYLGTASRAVADNLQAGGRYLQEHNLGD